MAYTVKQSWVLSYPSYSILSIDIPGKNCPISHKLTYTWMVNAYIVIHRTDVNMPLRDSIFAGCFALVLLLSRLGCVILTPLLYDSLDASSSTWLPVSDNSSATVTLLPSSPAWRTIDPIFCIASSMGFDVVVLGAALLWTMLCCSGQVTDREKNYPQRYFMMVGIFQAASAVMYQYSAPGERTPPYLQALLSYFPIPITFALR